MRISDWSSDVCSSDLSPDKLPARRLEVIEAAGRARVPFTTGLLIGIGETRAERIEALQAIRDSHARHRPIQEVIIQPFRAKPRSEERREGKESVNTCSSRWWP